jgi:tetratricopeptide (TPR) repeat protein
MLGRTILFTVALVTISSAALAQMGTGRAMGTVKDQDGQPIAGVKVTAQDTKSERKLEATTDDKGEWALLGFRSGDYDFSFVAVGYEPAAVSRHIQQTGRNPGIDVVLHSVESRQGGSAAGKLLSEANSLFDEHKYDEALAKYEELLAAEPTLYQVYFNIGTTYREMGEPDKAIEAFGKVLAEQPLHPGALVGTGEVLMSEGRLDEAVTYLESAVEHTMDEVVPFNVAEIYMGQGDSAKAIQFYQIASERKPEWAEPHLKMGYAQLGAGDLDAATAAFEKTLELAPPDSPQAQQAQAALNSLSALKK